MIDRFGDFALDYRLYQLRRGDLVVPIERRIFTLLAHLIRHRERVVTQSELREALWPGRKLSESSLSVAVSAARRALGEDSRNPSLIETCHGRGYRFTATVTTIANPPNSSPVSHVSASRDFVGRVSELTSLSESIDKTLDARSQVVLITGEPGIGKTRLSDEFSRIATPRTLSVLKARCLEGYGSPTYWPWTQLLRALLNRQGDDQLLELTEQDRILLSPICPEIVADPSACTTPTLPVAPDHSQFVLFDTVTRIVRLALAESPLAFVIDDLHRADGPSLLLLHFLARELRGYPLLVVGTYRDVELSLQRARAQTMAAIVRDTDCNQLPLRGLKEPEVAVFLSNLTTLEFDAPTVSLLQQRTGGNPFFLRQLAPLLLDRRAPLPPAAIPLTLPRGVTEAVALQLQSLSPMARQHLSVAAVIGRSFHAQILADVSSTESASVNDFLREAVAQHILNAVPTQPGHYEFSHVLVRDVVYEQMTPLARCAMHERIAQAIESKPLSSLDRNLPELAHHYYRAASPTSATRALQYCEAAANAAADGSDHADAVDYYSRALSLLDSVDPMDDAHRCKILLSLGSQLLRAGERLTAKATFERAAQLARRLGAASQLAEAALGVAPGFLAVEAGTVDYFLIDLLESALEALGSSDRALETRLLARLAIALHWSDEDARAIQAIERACVLADGLGDPSLSPLVMHAKWFTSWSPMEVMERDQDSARLLLCTQGLRDRELSLVCRLLRLVSRLENGDLHGFDRDAYWFSRMAEELRQPQALWYRDLFLSTRALLEGRFEEVEALTQRFAHTGSRVCDQNAVHSAMSHILVLRWEQGRIGEVLPAVKEAASRYPTMQGWQAALSWALVMSGELSAGAVEYEKLARGGLADLRHRFDWPSAVALTSEVCVALGDHARARVLYDMLLPLERTYFVIGLAVIDWGSVARHLGLLATVLGQYGDAERHFALAIEMNDRIGARAWAVHTRLDYARMLLRSGRARKRAEELVRTALESARKCGMVTASLTAESLRRDFHPLE